MSKKVPKNVADLQRLLFEYFPDEKPRVGPDLRFENTITALRMKGKALQNADAVPEKGKPKMPSGTAGPLETADYEMPFVFSFASMAYVRKILPPLGKEERGVVKVSDVVRAMWLMIYRGPIVALASLHKQRVKNLKATLFGEGAKRIVEKTIARKIGVEAAKELMRKLFVVKAYLEKDRAALADEDALRAAAGRTIGEFIALRLPSPTKFTRYTRWERTRK
jgi:hypothetical protein